MAFEYAAENKKTTAWLSYVWLNEKASHDNNYPMAVLLRPTNSKSASSFLIIISYKSGRLSIGVLALRNSHWYRGNRRDWLKVTAQRRLFWRQSLGCFSFPFAPCILQQKIFL
jgi:hypothetical protein